VLAQRLHGSVTELRSALAVVKRELGSTRKAVKAAQKAAETRARALEKNAREQLERMEKLAFGRFQELSKFLLKLEAEQMNRLASLGNKVRRARAARKSTK